MAVRALRIYPDPVLRKRCQEVAAFDEQLKQFLDDLIESMYAHQGVGLAAPQVGETIRAIVVDVAQKDGKRLPIQLVNPVLLEASAETRDFEEGCLSLPGEAEVVTRPARVRVAFQDASGRRQELEAEGLLATALQHEMDHLEGRLFIDHLSRLKRSLIDRRLRKRALQVAC